ncbi:MAG: indolepyruvate ferredoxin oxidoreductase subunit alpha [Chloroflexota bacterium]
MYIITLDEGACQGCGECVSNCPVELFEMVDDKAQVTGDTSECLGCESCVAVCESSGITLQEV